MSESLDYWPAGQLLPALLTDAQLRRVFGLSETSFRRWKRMGRFDRFEVGADAGVRRYSGLLVQRYLEGKSLQLVFGRKRA